MRNAVLLAALSVIVLLGVLTITVIVRHGLDPLTVISLGILAILGSGLYGALRDDGSQGGD